MDPTARDPRFAAQQVKFLRKALRLTLENLAEAAGVTILTIEKAESGRHRPDNQVLQAIARATEVDIGFFSQPATDEEEQRHAEARRALRTTVMVALTPLRSAADVLRLLDERRDYRLDAPSSVGAGALDAATAIVDLIRDLDRHWADCSTAERMARAGEVVDLCARLEAERHACWVGDYRRRGAAMRTGLISVRPDLGAGRIPFALVNPGDGAQFAAAADQPA